MIDALILGRPCIALVTEQYEKTQTRAQHFRHLLDSEALHVARTTGAAVAQLEAVAAGRDDRAEARQAFLAEFVRPQGMETNAGELVAATATPGTARARRRSARTAGQPSPAGLPSSADGCRPNKP